MTKATAGKNKTKLDIKCSGRLRKNIKSGFTIFESSLIPSASLPTKPRKFEKACIEQVLFLSSVSTLTWRTTWTNSFFCPDRVTRESKCDEIGLLGPSARRSKSSFGLLSINSSSSKEGQAEFWKSVFYRSLFKLGAHLPQVRKSE